MNWKKLKKYATPILLVVLILLSFVYRAVLKQNAVSVDDIPEFKNMPFVVLDNNVPNFSQKEKRETFSFERYHELDRYGRCGVAFARIGSDLFPTAERKSISDVKPSGWQSVKYDFISGKYLYNRCHLIGFQLAGENQNVKNLITGTKFFNVEGMLPFENMVTDYIRETDNHVLYRVTPIFRGKEKVARGVQMEALSVEDGGAGICFNVFVYNVQPGVKIDYKNGKSQKE